MIDKKEVKEIDDELNKFVNKFLNRLPNSKILEMESSLRKNSSNSIVNPLELILL